MKGVHIFGVNRDRGGITISLEGEFPLPIQKRRLLWEEMKNSKLLFVKTINFFLTYFCETSALIIVWSIATSNNFTTKIQKL